METIKGIEALKHVPFKDVVLPRETAVQQLTARANLVVSQNVDYFIANINTEHPKYQDLLEVAKALPNKLGEGGLSMKAEELDTVLNLWGSLPFEQVVDSFIEEVFPNFYASENDDPGVTCLGYLLDLIRAVDPQVASFDDCVHSVVNAFRRSNNPIGQMYILGAMVDDSVHLRGNSTFPFSFFADKEGAKQFAEAFGKCASEDEKRGFDLGVTMTLGSIPFWGYNNSVN